MADDDMNGADFQWADAGDVKKLQLHWSHKYSLSMFTHCVGLSIDGEKSSLLGISILKMMIKNWIGWCWIGKSQCRRYRKNYQLLWSHTYSLSMPTFVQTYLLWRWNPSSSTVFISAVMGEEDTDGADSQWATTGDVEKFTITLISQIISEHVTHCADLSVDGVKTLLFDHLYLCNYGWRWQEWCRFAMQ
jgi:hypothetical protein